MSKRIGIRQVARILGKSTYTVRRWVKRGWLPKPIGDRGWAKWDEEEIRQAVKK